MYQYGTSGFRYRHQKIENISENLGYIISYLSSDTNKHYGIMITASHNIYLDNGVKIINHKGYMISENEEKILEEYINKNNVDFLERNNNIPIILIGYDTRHSSTKICNLIISGIKKYNQESIIINFNQVSTPQLHYNVAFYKENKIQYYQYLDHLCKNLNYPIICDCSNGISGLILEKLKTKNNINLINTCTSNFSLLNYKCGSDYVFNNHTFPIKNIENDSLYCSLDGDADRIIFYFQDNEKFCLLDGDKICALIAYYISKKISNVNNIAVIHTRYSNRAFIKYIKKLGIKTVCTKTGVKNLHIEALKYNIGIYFEPNGHGTVLFNKSTPGVKNFKKFFHPSIGDGIMNLMAILYILQDTGINIYFWDDLYYNYPCKLYTLKVKDKNIFVNNENETCLNQPIILKNYIDDLTNENQEIFIRPSGTENCIRIYIESSSNKNIDQLFSLIRTFINKNYSHNEFTINSILFQLSDLKKDDYNFNYPKILEQLSTINCDIIDKKTFEDYVDSLDDKHMIKVLKIKDTQKIIGTFTILKETKLIHNFGKVAHIEDVVIDKSMRNLGLGHFLINQAKELCTDCYKIILNCSDKNIGFYQKCGFQLNQKQLAIYQ